MRKISRLGLPLATMASTWQVRGDRLWHGVFQALASVIFAAAAHEIEIGAIECGQQAGCRNWHK